MSLLLRFGQCALARSLRWRARSSRARSRASLSSPEPSPEPLPEPSLGELRVPLAATPPDVPAPGGGRIALLLHALHSVEEGVVLLELRPLVVDRLEGRGDVDRVHDREAPALAPALAAFAAGAGDLLG